MDLWTKFILQQGHDPKLLQKWPEMISSPKKSKRLDNDVLSSHVFLIFSCNEILNEQHIIY